MGCEVTVVCAKGAELGFRLVGLPTLGVSEEAAGLLVSLLEEGRPGIVAVARDVWETVPPEARLRLEESRSPYFLDVPLGVTVPEDEEEARARDYVGSLIERAIGLKIRLGDR